jgi:tRNA 2-(methylsulfanyl)-N6-isopentenyladenosine37 hydroxylase
MLKIASAPEWCEVVLADFDAFLIDHADCERKAAATAMALVKKFPEKTQMVEPMIALAREELAHFHEVWLMIHKRGLKLHDHSKDEYTKSLKSCIRHPREEHFLDSLLVAAVIEMRAHERLSLLADALVDHELKSYYTKLARIEAGHFKVFVDAAKRYHPHSKVEGRLEELLNIESSIFRCLKMRPAIH